MSSLRGHKASRVMKANRGVRVEGRGKKYSMSPCLVLADIERALLGGPSFPHEAELL